MSSGTLSSCAARMASASGRRKALSLLGPVKGGNVSRRWMAAYASPTKSTKSSVVVQATNVAVTDRNGKRENPFDRILSSLARVTTNTAATGEEEEVDHDAILLLQEAGMDREELQKLANRKPTPLRLADMYEYGSGGNLQQRLRNAQFLHQELPIRIAQRAVDILTLPHGLSDVTSIRQVAGTYLRYLRRIREIPMPSNIHEEEAFTDLLQSMVLDRSTVPMQVAAGLTTWMENRRLAKQEGEESHHHAEEDDNEEAEGVLLQEVEDALYRFFTARVGLRFITEHHILSSPRASCQDLRNVTSIFASSSGVHVEEDGSFLGCIQTNCNVVQEAIKVSELVVRQTKDYYGVCPEVDIVDCIKTREPRDFTYVPHHLHCMLGELLKNAARATVQRYAVNQQFRQLNKDKMTTSSLPPIRIVIVKGDEDVTIKVADKGGGIPRSRMAKIWKFAHSTADQDELSNTDFGTDSFSGLSTIRGFGLPQARIYARYFGGELTLKSMEGYGLDAYLHLPRLGDECENLPLRVRSSPGERDSMPNRSIRN